jgi:uncharacterized protein (DUF2236 family)
LNKRLEFTTRPRNRIAYVGALHPIYRETVGIAWSEEDEQKYRKLCAAQSRRSERVPRFLRTNPPVHLLRLGYRGPKLVSMDHLQQAEEKQKKRRR